jgi:hypothetical protein
MIGPSLLHELLVISCFISKCTVHLQVAVCFLFDVLPTHAFTNTPWLILQSCPRFLELWTVDVYGSFGG